MHERKGTEQSNDQKRFDVQRDAGGDKIRMRYISKAAELARARAWYVS